MYNCEIGVIINAHQEGLLLASTLISVSNAVAHAWENGIPAAVIVILDSGDAVTRSVAAHWIDQNPGASLHEVTCRDLGLARNIGVQRLDTKWVAFIDGDDLWGADWLTLAHGSAERDNRDIVWHPEFCVYFGAQTRLFMHTDMESSTFSLSALALQNLWTSLCFTQRTMLLNIPYKHINLADQLGYEDWSWNMSVIENQGVHKVVTGTGHLIRSKYESLAKKTFAASCLPHPSRIFCKAISDQQFEPIVPFKKN